MKPYAILISLIMLGVINCGCERHGRDTVFSIPEKFNGLLLISEDKENGSEPPIVNGQYVLVVPLSGKLIIKDLDIFAVMHKGIGRYTNGAYIPFETPASDTEIALFPLPYIAGQGDYYFVGTRKDFDPISKKLEFYKLPLATKIDPSMLKKILK